MDYLTEKAFLFAVKKGLVKETEFNKFYDFWRLVISYWEEQEELKELNKLRKKTKVFSVMSIVISAIAIVLVILKIAI